MWVNLVDFKISRLYPEVTTDLSLVDSFRMNRRIADISVANKTKYDIRHCDIVMNEGCWARLERHMDYKKITGLLQKRLGYAVEGVSGEPGE